MIAPDAGAVLAPWEANPHRLWSLWDMLETSALAYIELGIRIEQARSVFEIAETAYNEGDPGRKLTAAERDELRDLLEKLLKECKQLSLTTAAFLIESRIGNLPATLGEFDLLSDAVKFEIKGKLFLFVPSHRAKYYDVILPSIITTRFGAASPEIVAAGNSFAAELYTGCVFHAMRAAEIGVRVLAITLGVTFKFDIEFAEWGKIVGEIEPKIKAIESQPRCAQREADLAFYSEAASQFRYFNVGWRVRTDHARATFDEGQAQTVLDHTISFFQTLATRLKE